MVQGQSVEMAYMELASQRPNGRTVVLLHGKNFCAATWGDTARVLAASGYRVIVPDQIGFCKSSKPTGFQYSLYGMADDDRGPAAVARRRPRRRWSAIRSAA